MAPKKSFMKDLKKKSKNTPQQPTTADEYLAAGVDFEEAGGKWRSGDAAKSARFFVRAIECYDEALKKFPTSFDLAYNKARVQYELTQNPKLLKQLQWPGMQLLQTALDSSRYALNLNSNDADVLFNTAQVLTSLADGVSWKNSNDAEGDRASCGLLEEALGLFQRCLLQQEREYEQFQAQLASASGQMEASISENVQIQESNSNNSTSQSTDTNEEEQWVSVMEPITKDGLVDTLLALVETLSVLCSRSSRLERDAGKYLHTVEQFATPELLQKLSMYASGTERELDAAVGQAGLVSSISETKYRVRVIEFRAYSAAVEEAWARLDLEKHVEGLCNRAESYTTASNTIFEGEAANSADPSIISEIAKLQWMLFSLAAQDVTAASKFRDDDNIGKIFLMRGDLELSRASLGRPPLDLELAQKNRGVLLGNAEKYYRGAKVLTSGGETQEENEEATIKEALAKGLLGDWKELEMARKTNVRTDEILWQAVGERLVDEETLGAMNT
ncbi:hypothetical protein HYFRA_00005039 [Hymenoscyphus fraxineus]|uniref:TPR-like protein n=1 Tax=Hymenoscyphus fraxineus TaxID=746836 RepID=A0A9N9KNV0_9HELO|nr:hypothetical protein HYFRA_00005039 [Hymenoscyphus fraxineus]